MRQKLFTDKTDALQFAGEVQQAVDGHIDEARAVLMVTGSIRIIPAWIQWMGKWAVPMPVEPPNLTGEIVDDINQPVEQEGL